MTSIKRRNQVVNCSIDSQDSNTIKNLHFQFNNVQFESILLKCTMCRSHYIAAQPATNNDVLSISNGTKRRLRLLCGGHYML